MRPVLFTAVAASAFAASIALAQPAPRPDDAPPPPQQDRMERGGMLGRFMRRPPPKAAFFNLRRGDASVTIKCADDEPTKACTDAAAALIDALKGAPR